MMQTIPVEQAEDHLTEIIAKLLPGEEVVLTGNGQALAITFTPTDTTDYTSAGATVTLNVLPATPTITWTNPANIVYGTALSVTQLNATASLKGVALPGGDRRHLPLSAGLRPHRRELRERLRQPRALRRLPLHPAPRNRNLKRSLR